MKDAKTMPLEIAKIKKAISSWHNLIENDNFQKVLADFNDVKITPEELQKLQLFVDTAIAAFDDDQTVLVDTPNQDEPEKNHPAVVADKQLNIDDSLENAISNVSKELSATMNINQQKFLEQWVEQNNHQHQQMMNNLLKIMELENTITNSMQDLSEDDANQQKNFEFIQLYADLNHLFNQFKAQAAKMVGNTNYMMQLFSKMAAIIIILNKKIATNQQHN